MRGNTKQLRKDINEVVHQLRSTRTTFSYYRKKYGVSPYTLKHELLNVISEIKYLELAKAKLAQGNEPQRWGPGHIRGAAARKYKPIGAISIRTRRRKFGLKAKRRSTRITKIPFIKIKDEGTRDQCWMRLTEYNYVKANGPVPHGFYVVNKNGDTMDCRPENLVLSNRKSHILLNQQNFPGMSSRGSLSSQITKKLLPTINDIYGHKLCIWECSNCSNSYQQANAPKTCSKCGGYSFEKIILRRKTG